MAKTKAHTQQPAHKAQPAPHQSRDMGFVLAWLLLPVVLVCVAIYRWRVMRSNMGYRTVRYDG